MDLKSRTHWYEYSRARVKMMDATDTGIAPWYVVNNNDKRRGRLNCIAHLLDQIPYEHIEPEMVVLPRRSQENAYDDKEPMKRRRYVPEIF